MRNINDYINLIPASPSPLSSDVFFIDCGSKAVIYDVGSSDLAADTINNLHKDKYIVLSHFHRDHIANLSRINCQAVYGGKESIVWANRLMPQALTDLIKVQAPIDISEICDYAHSIQLVPLPNSHAKGSLAMVVDNDYCFVGDALYPAYKNDTSVYNPQLLQQEIKQLESIECNYFVVSHRKKLVYKKSMLLSMLTKIMP